jgi:hypothetical protein
MAVFGRADCFDKPGNVETQRRKWRLAETAFLARIGILAVQRWQSSPERERLADQTVDHIHRIGREWERDARLLHAEPSLPRVAVKQSCSSAQ